MIENQIKSALKCCCELAPINCRQCVLWEYKFNSDGTCNFRCSPKNYLQQKNLRVALEKVVRKNPKMFPRELVAQFGKARVV